MALRNEYVQACPLVSGVLYLSAVGGPTLVTDLAFGGGADEGATSARLVRPVPSPRDRPGTEYPATAPARPGRALHAALRPF